MLEEMLLHFTKKDFLLLLLERAGYEVVRSQFEGAFFNQQFQIGKIGSSKTKTQFECFRIEDQLMI